MKLSFVRKQAADALDRQRSGDETAAAELHAWAVANLDELAAACPGVQPQTIRDYNPEEFPAALLRTCNDKSVKTRAADAEHAKRSTKVDAAASALSASVSLDGISYKFDGAALAALAKLCTPATELFVGIRGHHLGIELPARALRDLNKVHALAECMVHMTSPGYGEWRFIVQWSAKGYWQSRIVRAQSREHVATFVPSMTDMVSAELGCDEVADHAAE